MTSLACPKGEELSQGYCYPVCTPGYTGRGPLCLKQCPAGFADLGPTCSKPLITRSNPINSIQKPCPPGQRDDGSNCWSDQNCSFVPTPDKSNFILQCTGFGTIKSTKQERTSCPAGYELIQNVCYINCPTGYSSTGTKCVANCPSGFMENGLHCVKPTISRQGSSETSMRSYGLKDITDDPRKSTLIKRIQIGSGGLPPTENTYKNVLGFGTNQTDASNAFQNFYSNASGGGSNASGSDSWVSPQTWFILFGLIAVIAFLAFGGGSILNVVGELGSTAVQTVKPVLVSTGESIGTAEKGIVNTAVSQATEALGTTLGTTQKSYNEALMQQKNLLEEIVGLQKQVNSK